MTDDRVFRYRVMYFDDRQIRYQVSKSFDQYDKAEDLFKRFEREGKTTDLCIVEVLQRWGEI